MTTPTLINLPPPPSDTPSDMGPGTPNSGTTSLSALSTTAIKDGHQGHTLPHHHGHAHSLSTTSNASTNTLDAERADRISRLAGLERVATLRSAHLVPGTSYTQPQQPAGYFDHPIGPQVKERSTIGSASATGSASGRTRTWASGSDMYEADKMSEDPDDGVSSSTGLSDEGNASLVGFGEAASSTISGPTSGSGRTTVGGRGAAGNPTTVKHGRPGSGSPMQGVLETNPAMLDGVAQGRTIMDTTSRISNDNSWDSTLTGQEQAKGILHERLDDVEHSR